MRSMLPVLILSVAACADSTARADLFSIDVREVAQRAAPQSSAQGLEIEHQQMGDRADDHWVQLDAYYGHMGLSADELPGFADRFCTELARHLQTTAGVQGSLDTGPALRTVRSGDLTTTTVQPSRYCAYRIRQGWAGAHLVILNAQSRAFIHVTVTQF